MLLSAFCIACAPAAIAQTPRPKMPESSTKVPSDPGAVVVPPATGSEEMAKTPKSVDPEMDDATKDIDRKNRKKSRKLRDKAAREKMR